MTSALSCPSAVESAGKAVSCSKHEPAPPTAGLRGMHTRRRPSRALSGAEPSRVRCPAVATARCPAATPVWRARFVSARAAASFADCRDQFVRPVRCHPTGARSALHPACRRQPRSFVSFKPRIGWIITGPAGAGASDRSPDIQPAAALLETAKPFNAGPSYGPGAPVRLSDHVRSRYSGVNSVNVGPHLTPLGVVGPSTGSANSERGYWRGRSTGRLLAMCH